MAEYPHINEKYVKDVAKLTAMNQRHFQSGIQGKMPYMLQWMQNINFLAGNQWISFNARTKQFEIDPNLDNESRVTFNKVLPAYRMAVGSLLRDRQIPKVLQGNNDEQSIDASKVSTKLLEHIRRVNEGLATQKEVVEWSAITGKGINKKWYDPDKKKIVDEVIQTFEFVTPSNVRKTSKMPWVCHARYETSEWVYEMYGLEKEGSSDYGQYGTFLSVVKNVMDGGWFAGSGALGNANNVLIQEFWYQPCKDYPKGLLAIYANDDLIYADKNPISGDDEEFYFPFNEMNFFDLPFRYWPMSLIEPIIGIQAYYNKFQSYALENFSYAGMPSWWALTGTVSQDQTIMKPGQVNEYSGATPPTPNNVQAIQPSMFEVINQLASGIGELVGIHQFGRGALPSGVHAAAALAIINEQDQIGKMGLTVNLEKFVRTDARQTLYLVRKFWPETTKIRVIGEENRWEVIEFNKSVLTGEEEIEIESKQELAQDKMTRFDQVMKLMTTPRVDNPKESIMDVNSGLRILDLESEMSTVSLRNLNWNMAKDENQRLAKGGTVMTLQYEDHKTHIEAHMQYMLRIEFKELDENIQNKFFEHYEQHVQMLNASQQSMGSQVTQEDTGQTNTAPQTISPQMGAQGLAQPNVMPFPPQGHPQAPPMPPHIPTGIQPGLQGGMRNVMNHAVGNPGGRP